MADENKIQTSLVGKFPWLADKIRVPRERRIFVEAPLERLREVFAYLYQEMDFIFLAAITGLDLGKDLGAIYHLARANGTMLNLQTQTPKANPVLLTVTDLFPVAEAFERELNDLLGFQVQGLPEGARYPLPDDWPAGEHPLRKDWNPPGAKGPGSEGDAP